MDTYHTLCDFVKDLKIFDKETTTSVGIIRELYTEINTMIRSLLAGDLEISDDEIERLRKNVDNVISGKDINISFNVKTTVDIEMFQLGTTSDVVDLVFEPNSIVPPEKGTIIQKLWKVGFKDNTTGYGIMSEATTEELSTLLNAQMSVALLDSPIGAVEDLGITISLNDIQSVVNNDSRDLSNLFTGLEKPGLVARQLKDIDIDTDPALISLSVETRDNLKIAVSNNDIDGIKAAGLYSESLGPTPNLEYSDLKRFKINTGEEIITVVLNIPIISWGDDVTGIPLRDMNGPSNKTNRKDAGTSYIVDLGGLDPVIRNGRPNPLPDTKFYNWGPYGSRETEGALDRYTGGKCLGLNTTNTELTIQTYHREKDGVITLTIPPMSAIWKLDRSTFDGGNKHAYYTVYSTSRAPASGVMGVVLAPKQNRLGRGRGETASGTTLANGISKTEKTFNIQDSNGPILTDGLETPSNLKGVTCDYDGHGMDAKDLLKYFQENSFNKGVQYLTIPSDATSETVEDVLIPAGQFIPQITKAVGTLLQFGNGKYIQNGGPARFQSGLVPFHPGTPAYTPEWQINFIYYNCGEVECDNDIYPITDVANDNTIESWGKPVHNVSAGLPGPNSSNSIDTGYSPSYPDTFDPVQLRCGIKSVHCREYIDKLAGSIDSEIAIQDLTRLEDDNSIFITEAPGGANRGWVKFLIVNCPLPVVVTINVVGKEVNPSPSPTPTPEDICKTCTCDRVPENISINGDFNPIWLEDESVIGTRTLKLKVGDNIIFKATSGTHHGVSLRMDNMTSAVTIDNSTTLEQYQIDVLDEIRSKITINNEEDIDHNVIAMSDDVITFHGGVPITFTDRAVVNPTETPNGVVIADLTIKEGTENMTGSISCTVHGVSMSFKFSICPE